jgi:hypothetical protein
MKIKEKREAGEILQRSGISQRIISLAESIVEGTYKNAIERAGQISVLVDAASYDDYWSEKASIGKTREEWRLKDLNKGVVTRDKLLCEVYR